jgi:hypothetical protein
MQKKTRIQFNTMKGAKQFVLDHQFTPPNVVLNAASTALGTSITNIEALDSGWDVGKGTFLGAAEERKLAKDQLYKMLSDLSFVSKSLDKTTYPDVAAQLKMSNHKKTYQGVLAFGRAAVAVIEPIKEAFTAQGFATTVVEDLEALVAAVETAGNRKLTGKASRNGKTAALQAEAKIGMTHVRKIDGILSHLYRNNVELYTAWKTTKRQQTAMVDEEQEAPAPGSGSGSGGSQPVGS